MKYADDIVLVSNSAQSLQNSLDIVFDYCNTWKLNLNLTKTKVLVCRRGGPLGHNEHWFWGEKRIDICQCYKYLGINFSAGGITKRSISVLADQARKALLSLQYRQKQLGNIPVTTSIKLFNTCITPILLYSSQVWGYKNVHDVEKVFLNYLKSLLGVRKTTVNTAVYCEIGELPLRVFCKYNMTKFWVKLIIEDVGKLTNVMYSYLYENVEVYPTGNWAKEIKTLLDHCGFSDVWQSQQVLNSDVFLKNVFDRLCDQAKAACMADIKTYSKLKN